jgi:hypothetical protein
MFSPPGNDKCLRCGYAKYPDLIITLYIYIKYIYHIVPRKYAQLYIENEVKVNH